MPWRNRVNPFGEIEAVPERGTVMGNRGCLINRRRELIRPFQLERWICCVLEFKGRRRPVMTPGLWTELFFLDEATALAAGHRPCCECRRADARRFLEFWNRANGQNFTRFPQLDAALHEERLRSSHPLTLADGVLVASADRPYLYWQGCFREWTYGGYGTPEQLSGNFRQLTPASIARALAQGYRPRTHPTV
jgi:hypothetical protein